MVAFAFLLTIGFSFGLGVLTDRYLLPPRGQKETAVRPPQSKAPPQPAGPQAAPPTATRPGPAVPTPAAEPSLTFYDTLPKGGKAILGSGINLKKEEIRSAPSAKGAPSNTTLPPQHQKPARPEAAEAQEKRDGGADKPAAEQPGGKGASEPSVKKIPAQRGKFSVQVASSKDRKEAEAIKSRLGEKGVTAYIVESALPDKGTWYRVRVGRQMDQSTASDTASRLGKEAIVVPE